ncbi:MAG: extracellular solute-binding protein [Chloroflexi bacterium]|nr:extracellular solute-binding protein [Chloroflexota bacterium]
MKKIAGLAISVAVFLIACAPEVAPQVPVSIAAAVAAPGAAWEQTWERVLNDARKEGNVVIVSAFGPEVATPLNQAFTMKHGVGIEFGTGRIGETAQRVIAHRKAGLYTVDLYMGGIPTGLNTLKPAGAFDPLETALILPEVTDPRNWLNGKLTFVDRDRTLFPYVHYAVLPLGINTDLVKPEEIKSHRDLLNPRFKGKMVMFDPTGPGASVAWFNVVSKIAGLDYMRDLARQDPVIVRDERLQWDWIAQGKYPVGIAPASTLMGTFTKAGARVQLLAIDGTFTGGGSSYIALLNRAPHPNTARLFLNWFLAKEGQTIMSQATLLPSARVDVSKDHVIPETLPKPGYFDAINEDFQIDLPNQMRIAREMFGHLLK